MSADKREKDDAIEVIKPVVGERYVDDDGRELHVHEVVPRDGQGREVRGTLRHRSPRVVPKFDSDYVYHVVALNPDEPDREDAYTTTLILFSARWRPTGAKETA